MSTCKCSKKDRAEGHNIYCPRSKSYASLVKTKQDSSYNGWANYETWNVALWIANDEALYSMAREYRYKGYKHFALALKELANPRDFTIHQIAFETPDGVSWNDLSLDIKALNKMMKEL